jgi:hypothetical protein
MGSRRRLSVAALVALAAIAPHAAHAQPAASPPPAAPAASSPADRASARALAADADRKIAAGDYAGAADSFAKAYAFEPAPTLKVARAHVLLKLGRLIEAQEDLLDAARSEPQAGERPAWGEARRKANEEAESITARIPLLDLGVTGAPMDRVTLRIDGIALATATLGAPHAVNPGPHAVRAEAEGYVAIEQVVTLEEGERRTLTFPLSAGESVPQSPPSRPAPIQPAPIQATPAPRPEPPVPTPFVSTVSLPHRDAPPSNALSTAAWIGTGVAGGTALLTGLIAIVDANDVKTKCTGNVCPTSTQSQAYTSATLGNVSTVAFVVTGAGLLLAIFTYHSAPSPKATGVSFEVVVGPGSIGAVGRF